MNFGARVIKIYMHACIFRWNVLKGEWVLISNECDWSAYGIPEICVIISDN